MVGIDLDGQTSVDGVCLRGISPGKRCQLQLTDQHSSTSPLRIMLRTKCSKFAPTTGKSAVNVKLTSVLGVNNPFWQSHVFPEIKVTILCRVHAGVPKRLDKKRPCRRWFTIKKLGKRVYARRLRSRIYIEYRL